MKPCLYEVAIRHSRVAPVRNAFRYRSYMWLFDLDRPPRRFRPRDHMDVRAELRRHGIEPHRIVVLTNIRVLGYLFNPISVYWCYDPAGSLVAHVAEVHNTYGDRLAYVMPVMPVDADHSDGAVVTKAMYVSPFYPVDGRYHIRISEPRDRVTVSVTLERPGDEPFTAGLTGRRVEATVPHLIRALVRYPAAPLRGRALIQYQGLRLWWKGLEVQPR